MNNETGITNTNNNINSKIKITLSGGGINGLQYIGMFYSFELNHFTPNMFEFHTSSIGSIIAALWTIGYSSKELMNIFIYNNLYCNYEPECNFIHLLNYGGLDNSNKFKSILKNLIYIKLNKHIKLYDIPNLYIYGSNITENACECFHQCDIFLYQALSISSCIPLLYNPIYYKDNYYVDAALINNTPNYINVDVICVFNSNHIDKILSDDISYVCNETNVRKIILNHYIIRLIECGMNSDRLQLNNMDLNLNQNQLKITFDKNYSSLNFWIDKENKISLIKNGFNITNKCNYIEFFNKIIK
jgi:hypothetical protein